MWISPILLLPRFFPFGCLSLSLSSQLNTVFWGNRPQLIYTKKNKLIFPDLIFPQCRNGIMYRISLELWENSCVACLHRSPSLCVLSPWFSYFCVSIDTEWDLKSPKRYIIHACLMLHDDRPIWDSTDNGITTCLGRLTSHRDLTQDKALSGFL